ncbi:MAG: bile acid:sodium symporter family protein [Pseudomonadota bacterium]|nr:bile acid:sodium symporter family protein [Pseudomonadota bacterium]
MSRVSRALPLLALGAALIAGLLPAPFAALQPALLPLLGAVMFAMGLTLTPASFASVRARPAVLLLGVTAQFFLMPLLAWLLVRLLRLPEPIAVGLVLVGAAPGGTASNVMCFLARGDLALSVSLTALSTLLAVLFTPALATFYLGAEVAVPALGLLRSVAEVVLAPVLAGFAVRWWFGARLAALEPVLPGLAAGAIALIIAIVVAMNHDLLGVLSGATLVAVALHNAGGLAMGYGLARITRQDEATCRTLALEVGMQNSGLAALLGAQHFGAAAALPGAVFSVWHNLSGAALAGVWARRAPVARHG